MICRPQYSADWGDYVSLAQHFRNKADADGTDLIIVDTGDRVEGNGIYDASKPRGKYTFDILKEQHIDVICSGNHELYKARTAADEFHKTVPDFKGHYISSNIDIYNAERNALEPLAPRYRKFVTKNQGIRVTAFGFLFDFSGNANNTVVQPVEETVNEKWFQDAIRDKDVDLFLVTGHVPVRDSQESNLIFETIRKVKWDIPIQFLGGHTHIRDYVKYDARAFGLESGRFLETIGFASVSGINSGGKQGTANAAKNTFSRRYIDNNLYSFHHHTNTNATTFPTEHGRNVSAAIASARKSLNLDKTYGCAPQNYWINRAPYPDKDSMFTWLEQSVLPKQIGGYQISNRDNKSATVIVNTGALRFDIFKGPVTRDTTYLVSPFTSGFRLIENVPREIAAQVLPLLNRGSPPFGVKDLASPAPVRLRLGSLSSFEMASERTTFALHGASQEQVPIGKGGLVTEDDEPKEKLSPGYTTVDDAGKDGDDTEHQPIEFFAVPNCFATNVEFPQNQEELGDDSRPETVDLVYNAFVESWVLLALQFLGADYSLDDTSPYMEGKSFTSVITDWIEENWTCED
ncbi:MAG: hypothetical protein M1822_009672 [Bathelium mastoideum]|nr:MAG: hypothetical protein M1822_009672 [Bathelium mastoideum]